MDTTDLKMKANSSSLSHEYGKPICDSKYVYSDKPIENKEIILQFLKSFSPSWFTSARVSDVISGETIEKCNNVFSDGGYEWTEAEIYHFEKYNLQLDNSFIRYVLKK